MDEHPNLSRANGSNHTKSYTSTAYAPNGATYPTHAPRMSYNAGYSSSNKEIVGYK